jgi:hypothetical protein
VGGAGGAGGIAGTGGAGGGGGASACASDLDCADGRFCNGVEVCANGACHAGTPPDCDDGIQCTTDLCDASSDQCAHARQDDLCANEFFCDGAETCDPELGDPVTGCVAQAPPDCSDGIPCTVDTCNEAQRGCDHAPDDAACSDGLFCNGAEVCAIGIGCRSADAPPCDDAIACTIDTCSEADKACSNLPNDLSCSDGKLCNGVERCDPGSLTPTGCVAGAPVLCVDDGIACTDERCDDLTGACSTTPNNAHCPSGEFCVVGQAGCTAGEPCDVDSDCDDADACNGSEACSNGICVPGSPVDCNDGVTCTVDSCNPGDGTCLHLPSAAACDDGLVCNGTEICDPTLGCRSGQSVDCNDGVDCTIDQCSEPNGACVHYALDIACDDDDVCNGAEVCTPQGCQAGAPFLCPSDGVACTTEVCDPGVNGCISVPNNDACPCGQTCDAVSGCGNHCKVATCQGKVYQCGDCIDNDGDCKVDSGDESCLGPCQNSEEKFYGSIPGQNSAPCKQDCYFDQDTGGGNDGCQWNHKCDPYEQPPNYSPEGSKCAYQPSATCDADMASQSQQCHSYCGPLTPNGCDCFGCCAIPGAPTTVWVGSEANGAGTCTLDAVGDPAKCKPCTQVVGCLNSCEECELCVGKPELPPQCTVQQCPGGAPPCGLGDQAPCGAGFSCITGCCQANPQ